jgi:ADP-ribose pyrophosphatase
MEYFKGRLINVSEKKTILPNGHAVTFEIVNHPGAVLIIPFMSNDAVIMLCQYRPVIDAYIYELPAGTLGKGEKSAGCAHRELSEETGYKAKTIKKIGEIYPCPGYSTERIILFTARELTVCPRQPEKDEIIKTYVMNRQEVKRLFSAGKIVDAKTICALAMCGWMK